jgi:hypothetical protein
MRSIPALILVMLTLSGCAITAPRYVVLPEEVQALREAQGSKVRLGDFTAAPGLATATTISIRANPMTSPYGSYAEYLKEALHQEFDLSGRLAPDSAIEITGVLTENDISAPIGTGSARLAARIVVRRGGAVTYDQVQTASLAWDSVYLSPVAIPQAVNEYPAVVQRLVTALVHDQSFLAAIR